MNDAENSARGPRPPGAIEKVEPGVKRILAGTVADILEVAHAENAETIFNRKWCQGDIIRTADPIRLMPVHFVDNVITTGTMVAACRHTLEWGTGLAYADGVLNSTVLFLSSSRTTSQAAV